MNASNIHPIHIVYINLDHREDRRAHIEQQFEKYCLSPNVERFGAISNSGFGIWGCGMSHLAVLRLAQERGYPYVWIMEDDFEFTISPEEFSVKLAKLLASPEFERCDVFMAAFNMRSKENINEEYDRVFFAQTASSYIVKAHYYQKLIDLYEDAMPKLRSTWEHWNYANDIVWRELQTADHWICPVVRWGKQMEGYSDNAQCVINYNC